MRAARRPRSACREVGRTLNTRPTRSRCRLSASYSVRARRHVEPPADRSSRTEGRSTGRIMGRNGPINCAAERPQVARSRSRLFDRQGAACQPRVDPDRRCVGKDSPARELVPDRECEAQIDVLGAVSPVVDPVVVRAHQNAPQWAEAEVRVGVGERHEGRVADENRGRYRAVRQEDDARDQCHQIGHVQKRVGSKDGERVHVLLGMVQLVKSPQHAHPVIRQMDIPVQPVHAHEDRCDDDARGTAPICGRTIHGNTRLVTSTNDSVNAVMSGTMRVTLRTV